MQGRDFNRFTKRIVDGSKIEDHHAIIVTDKIRNFDFNVLTEVERNVLHMIITRILTALSAPAVYNETTIEVDVNQEFFYFRNKVLASFGYEEVEELLPLNKKEKEEIELTRQLNVGDTVELNHVYVKEKKTTPPALHTEATLLNAMEHASNSITDEAEKESIKECGIGTKATRAGIIKELFKQDYIQYTGTGKVKRIIPTERGIQLISIVPEELKSASLTADIEMKLNMIAKKEISQENCMQEITSFINQIFDRIKTEPVPQIISSENDRKRQQVTERQVLGFCPYCGGKVYEGVNNFYCEHHKSERGCNFQISKKYNMISNLTKGKELTSNDCMDLLLPRGLTTMCTSKQGKTFKANFKIAQQYSKEYNSVQFDMILLKSRRRRN